MSVQCLECFPPASLASSSFGIPVIRPPLFLPSVFFNPFSSFSLIMSITPETTVVDLITFFKNFCSIFQAEPNCCFVVVILTLVWESNFGLIIRQLTKTHKWFFTICGLIVVLLDFFAQCFVKALVS